MRRYTFFLMQACLVLLFVASCGDKTNQLAFLETNFSVSITCIAKSQDPNIFYIGFENGNIIKKNIIDNTQKLVYKGNNNRIYDVYEENDSVLWIGIRDEGLKRVEFKRKDSVWIGIKVEGLKRVESEKKDTIKKSYDDTIEKPYYIRVPGQKHAFRTRNYAPYKIVSDNGDLYIASSSGVYTITQEEQKTDAIDTLTLLYRPDSCKDLHFGINQILIKDSLIYCATANSGLVKWNKREPYRVSLILPGEVTHLYQKDSIIYASSDACLYEIIKDSVKSYKPEENLFAYIIDSLDGKWVLTLNQILYWNKNNSTGKHSMSFDFPDRMNKSYKNIIHYGKDFILVACKNQLYSFAIHQNPWGNTHHVIAAHTMRDNNCYFITNDNWLHLLKTKDSTSKPIGKIEALGEGERVVGFCSSKKYLWLISDKQLCRINRNHAESKIMIGEKEKIEFKSIAFIDQTLYVGSRKYTYKIPNPDDRKEIRPDSSITIKVEEGFSESDMYVTDICNTSKGILFSTLNKGLFQLQDNLCKIPGSDMDSIGSIRKMVNWGDASIFLFSSKNIYLRPPEGSFDTMPNIPINIISTIFKRNNGLFLIGYHGIGTFSGDKREINNPISFLDLSFNNAAIAKDSNEETLLVGSQTGLYRYNPEARKPAEKLTPIIITPKPTYTEWWVIGSVLFTAIVLYIILAVFKRKKVRKEKGKINDIINPIKGAADANSKKIKGDVDSLETEIAKKWRVYRLPFVKISNIKRKVADLETQIQLNQQLKDIIRKIDDMIENKISNYVKKEYREKLNNDGGILKADINQCLNKETLNEDCVKDMGKRFNDYENNVNELYLTTEQVVSKFNEFIENQFEKISKYEDQINKDASLLKKYNDAKGKFNDKANFSIKTSIELLKDALEIGQTLREKFAVDSKNNIDKLLFTTKFVVKRLNTIIETQLEEIGQYEDQINKDASLLKKYNDAKGKFNDKANFSIKTSIELLKDALEIGQTLREKFAVDSKNNIDKLLFTTKVVVKRLNTIIEAQLEEIGQYEDQINKDDSLLKKYNDAKERFNDRANFLIKTSMELLKSVFEIGKTLREKFAENLPPKKEIDFSELIIPEELENEIKKIEAAFNKRKATNKDDDKLVKKRCDSFIEKFASHFRGYIKIEKNDPYSYILILHYIEDIEPKDIFGLDFTNKDNLAIGKYKYYMLNQKIPRLFKDHSELKDNPYIMLLYKRMQGK